MERTNEEKANDLTLAIADRINQLMHNNRLSITKLSEMSGVNRLVLHKLFNGKPITMRLLTKIMAALNVKPENIKKIE